MTALLDTGFLLAVLDADDKLHEACVDALLKESGPLLPDAVLPELAYMVLRDLGYPVLIRFIRSLVRGEIALEKAELADLDRAAEILEKYADSRVDFVDCVIVALAERLQIQRILTVDQRHFGIFQPKHCSHFQILP
ncbi:MAG: PIN domain-containing protein [bacterium]|nr:PIN domain-containing protein [bacterium]